MSYTPKNVHADRLSIPCDVWLKKRIVGVAKRKGTTYANLARCWLAMLPTDEHATPVVLNMPNWARFDRDSFHRFMEHAQTELETALFGSSTSQKT